MNLSLSSVLSAAASAACGLLLLRIFLSFKSLLYLLGRGWRWMDEWAQSYQTYEIPQRGESGQQNPLYRKAAAYVASLPSVEDCDGAQIFSTGRKSNDFFLHPGPAHKPVPDLFRGARLHWSQPHPGGPLLLRLRRQDRHRVLRPYLQHVESVADDLDLRKKELRLFTNDDSGWRSVGPFAHPATIDTVAMDPELKSRIRSDLESFLKGRTYYGRLGRPWRRSYLLYGPPGTGKSTFVAAMAKLLGFDIYELDLHRAARSSDVDLRSLLLQTAPKSLILVEDLDRYLKLEDGNNKEEERRRMSEMLNFMDGIFSCCGEERVMVFTMSGGGDEKKVDPALLRPGRLDVHVHFPLCDFPAFKSLASGYLGLKDHKLYNQIEEGFQGGARLSPAEVGEMMIANRGSPSRALKTVIGALQRGSPPAARSRAASESGSVNGRRMEELEGCGPGGGITFGKDATVREFKKLYGLIRRSGSKRDGTMSVEMAAAAAAAANAAAAGHNGNNANALFDKDGL